MLGLLSSLFKLWPFGYLIFNDLFLFLNSFSIILSPSKFTDNFSLSKESPLNVIPYAFKILFKFVLISLISLPPFIINILTPFSK